MPIYKHTATISTQICKTGCLLNLTNTKVSIFHSHHKQCPDEPRISKTFEQISSENLAKRKSDFLGEAITDENGNIEISIDSDKYKYTGGCIEVVVTISKIPESDYKFESEEHYLLAYYSPDWRQSEHGHFHYLALTIPSSIWCALLKRHDLWLICGHVTSCKKPNGPIGGVTVTAFDADWIQHDNLGSASTNSSGWFYLLYHGDAFKKTPLSPFINIEWTGGPDLFFKIEALDSDGNTVSLLDEPSSRARQADREDVTNCFCVELCVDLAPTPPNEIPMWTRIGNYQIPDSASLHDFRADGYTQVGNLAFHRNMTMIGQTGVATASRQLRYRFSYERDWTGPTPPATPITKEMICQLNIGNIVVSESPLVLEPVYINNPGALHNHEPDVAGWIEVESDPRYTPTGNSLLCLNSSKLAPAQNYANPSPNSDAGDPATIDAARETYVYSLRYELEENTGSGWTPVYEQIMEKLVINNASTLLWLELSQFITGASLCHPITTEVTALYTVDHPHLDWYQIEIQKQGSHMHWPVPTVDDAGSISFRGGNFDGSPATPNNPVNVSAWENCSYIVFLKAHRRLTNGYGGPGTETVYRTFCKA